MAPVSLDSGALHKVWEIRTMKKVNDAEAMRLLEAAAKQVQPIMRKRQWKVHLLSEFSPKNPGLLGLNVNGGQEVRIRLRRHGRDGDFFPYDHILGTLLHELTHNRHGPHDARFYKLLDEITEGFDGGLGRRLAGDGSCTHNAPLSAVRQVAARAAEQRSKVGRLMPAGARRLGGDAGIMSALSPVQAAAMAAERRMRDDLWCAGPATGGTDGRGVASQEEDKAVGPSGLATAGPALGATPVPAHRTTPGAAPAAAAARNAKIDAGAAEEKKAAGRGSSAVAEGPKGAAGPPTATATTAARRKAAARREAAAAAALARASAGAGAMMSGGSGDSDRLAEKMQGALHEWEDGARAAARSKKPRSLSGSEDREWECATCTLLNGELALQCGACGQIRPQPQLAVLAAGAGAGAGGGPGAAAAGPGDVGRGWTCRQCTLANPNAVERCAACDMWRHSYGPPAASFTPYVGS
eukprot:jgi/Mesen1/11078/ME000099S10515